MARNLINGSVAFVGIGEGGSAIANQFKELGYTTYFINTAIKDLSKVDVPSTMKYHIPLALGCVKNRDKAKEYTKEYYDIIASHIETKLGNFAVIFVCFSMAGGTGSGISPILINTLAKRMPSITFGTIGIIPDDASSPKMKFNACECYEELKKVKDRGLLGNSYFINNNNVLIENKQIMPLSNIDKSFASKLHDLISLSSSDGSVDEAEVLELLKISGNTLIAEILPNNPMVEDRVVLDMSMSETEKGCTYYAYSITTEENFIQQTVESKFGKAGDYFKAIGTGADFVVSFGMEFPDNIMMQLYQDYREDLASIEDELRPKSNTSIFGDGLGKFINPAEKKVKEEKAAKVAKDIFDELEDF